MPEIETITGIAGVRVEKIEYRGAVILKSKLEGRACCPDCQAKAKALRFKEWVTRKLQHVSLGDRRSYLEIQVPKYQCRNCKRYFRQEIPGVLKYQRVTQKLKETIVKNHNEGMTKKALSESYKISHSTVENYYFEMNERKARERINRLCPRVLGIDEHFLNRKTGYVTTMVNLGNHKVFDILPGRSEKAIGAQLLKLKGRDRVQVVVMDLSSAYRRLVEKYFPNAKIVADRFHVVRLLNHALLGAWKQFDEQGRKSRGLLSLMRRHPEKLTDKQKANLERYFAENPGLGECYTIIKKLIRLMLTKSVSQKRAKRLIPKLLAFIEQLRDSPFTGLAKTLDYWLEPLVRMWRFTKTNSITEGLHNKMERIQRQACGFHSFHNYRIRVIALCG